jgi:hypothetical protein
MLRRLTTTEARSDSDRAAADERIIANNSVHRWLLTAGLVRGRTLRRAAMITATDRTVKMLNIDGLTLGILSLKL